MKARDTFVHFTKALDNTRQEDCATVFPQIGVFVSLSWTQSI